MSNHNETETNAQKPNPTMIPASKARMFTITLSLDLATQAL